MRQTTAAEGTGALASTAACLARSAAALTGDRQVAERLVHRALRGLATRSGGDLPGRGRRALYRAASLRRGGRRTTSPRPAADDPLVVGDPHCMADRVRADALAALDRKLRAVLVLRHVDGLDEERSAAVLDLPVDEVAAHYRRALADLGVQLSYAAQVAGGDADVERDAGRTLRTLADQVWPNPDGQALAASALEVPRRRRWRWRALGGAVIAATVVTTAVLVGLVVSERPAERTRVVASYFHHGRQFVLDPQTGEYDPHPSPLAAVAVSPDLRQAVTPGAASLTVVSTGGGQPQEFPLPVPIDGAQPVWSPDGTQVAIAVAEPTDGERWLLVRPVGSDILRYWALPFRQVLLVQPDTGDSRAVPLELPDDRVGAPGGAPAWLGPDRIAVVTAAADPKPGGIGEAVSVFDLDGRLLRQFELPPQEGAPVQASEATGWRLVPGAVGGTLLVWRSTGGGALELSTVSPASGEGQSAPVPVTLPEPPSDAFWHARVLSWRPDGPVLLEASQLPVATIAGDDEPAPLPPLVATPQVEWWTVDLHLGTTTPADLPVPADATQLSVESAHALSELAGELAF